MRPFLLPFLLPSEGESLLLLLRERPVGKFTLPLSCWNPIMLLMDRGLAAAMPSSEGALEEAVQVEREWALLVFFEADALMVSNGTGGFL